ncbi:hypothetical protein QE152_g35906 [Popillia japonica]|uniref:Reverse transcriptase n=1 Tax=Popillia japonica TaxID=7064 RepID=A0AAW1IEU5_POPJA
MCHLSITNEALHEQIQRFWEIEETNTHKALTSQESECEKHFINTYKRDVNGRYEVSLPVKDNHMQLGNSRETAIKRFRNLEHRLQKTPALKVDYVNFMREYETLGHMTNADRDYQRIAWREQPQDELKYYRLNTVTYGTAPASFLAVRALHQAAMDNGADPRVINIIKSDFYMDDLITGTDTLEDAVYLKHQISDVLQRGCFPLRKTRYI